MWMGNMRIGRAAIFAVLGGLMIAFLAACGGDDPTRTSPPPPAATATATTPPEATSTPTERQAKLTAGLIYRGITADWDRSTAEVQRIIPLAQAEGKVLLTSYSDDSTRAWCLGFTAEFGIECENRGIGAAQITAALVTAREAGQADTDVVNLAMSHSAQITDKGYVEEVDWDALGVDDRRAWDPNPDNEGNFLGSNQNQYTHYINTDLVDLNDLPDDIFGWNDPKWKGLLCGNAFLFRAGQGFTGIYYDIDRIVKWGQDLIADNDLVVTQSCDPLILSGELPVYIFGYGNSVSLLANPNIVQYWNPGMGVNLFSNGVLNNAPHPNAAKLLAAWMTSKAGSQASWDCCAVGWPGYGHASAGITTGDFAAQMVYESTATFRDRIKWQTQFSEEVFPGAQ